MRAKLTKRTLDALKPPASDRLRIFDTELTGFGAVKLPTGATTFFARYRPTPGGRERHLTLGAYGPLTVEDARREAKKILGRVARGEDPAAERAASRAAATVAAIGAAYLDDVRARRKERTAGEYARLWAKHVLPALGSRRVVDVTPADVAALHRQLRTKRYLANRVLALVGAFFAFAERQGVRPKHSNPAHEIEAYPEQGRERFLSGAEITRLGKALTQAERHGLPAAPNRRRPPATGRTAKHRAKNAGAPIPANPYAVAAIRFLLLSGWREREALTLRWDAVNLEQRRATLADTKTGRSHRPLGAPACELLAGLPRLEGSPFVFPGRDAGKPLVEINRVWYAARHAAALDDVRLHDLRHSFASIVASAGGSLLMIRALLGHKDTTTTQKYAHLLPDPVQATADATAAQLAAWLSNDGAATRTTTLKARAS